jgi:hypothetical protein
MDFKWQEQNLRERQKYLGESWSMRLLLPHVRALFKQPGACSFALYLLQVNPEEFADVCEKA